MAKDKSNQIKIIDKLIFWLIILFLITLTNSIFLNQIGYFIPLMLFAYRFVITKENKFQKNGLEIGFILFLAAELISAIFSVNHAQAFQNFFKRLVLIPLVYTIAAAADDNEKTKLFFKIYLGAALLTMLAYIVFAYEHFIAQLYRFEAKGPSPFQYVMTAGGLMSFTTIFTFAFLVNEKTKMTYRFFFLAAFGVAALGLFASYTRAAWIGAAAGILFIILFKKKWWLIIPGAAFIIFALLFYKNESRLYEYQFNGSRLTKVKTINTEGRAYNLDLDNDTVYVADYNKGIAVYSKGNLVQELATPSPSKGILKWKSNYYLAYLLDTRILLLHKDGSGKLTIEKSFTSPGLTTDVEVFGDYFYVADRDSGLTIYKNPLDLNDKLTLRNVKGVSSLCYYDKLFAAFDMNSFSFKVYSSQSALPEQLIDSVKFKSSVGFVWINKNDIFFQGDKLFHYVYDSGKVKQVQEFKIVGLQSLQFMDSSAIGASADGIVYRFDKTKDGIFTEQKIGSLGYSITGFKLEGNKIYTTESKRNRLSTIADLYHETNFERLNIWRIGLRIFKDHPLFGVGDIDLNKIYSEYKDYFLKENFGHMHNNFVHFLVILGAFGFIAVMFLLYKILRLNLKIYKTLKDVPFMSSYALGALAAFIGFLFSGLAEWNFGDQEIITMVWFTVGLNVAFYRNFMNSNNESTNSNG